MSQVQGYRQQRRKLRPCGTPGARLRHYKRGEPIDKACELAWREYENNRKRARRAAARADRTRAAQRRAEAFAAANRRSRTVTFADGSSEPMGWAAGTDTVHRHTTELGVAATMCLVCYGWCDDVRHAGEDRTALGTVVRA